MSELPNTTPGEHEGPLGNPPIAEEPAEHALLGVLFLAGGVAHGYDLARQFQPGQPLSHIISLKLPLLYKFLKKLERRGWVSMTTIEQTPRPPRQICHLTPTGEAELRHWVSEPVAHMRDMRLAFFGKLYLAQRIDPALATQLIRSQHTVLEQLATVVRTHLASAEIPQHSMIFEFRLTQIRAAQTWLTHLARSIPFEAPPHVASTH